MSRRRQSFQAAPWTHAAEEPVPPLPRGPLVFALMCAFALGIEALAYGPPALAWLVLRLAGGGGC